MLCCGHAHVPAETRNAGTHSPVSAAFPAFNHSIPSKNVCLPPEFGPSDVSGRDERRC